MAYVMESGSLGAALADLFTSNSSLAEISIEDIERLIDTPAAKSGRIDSLLKTPVYNGVFDRVQSADGKTAYRKGPEFYGSVN